MKSSISHWRGCLPVALSLLVMAGAAHAVPIVIYNTGVNGSALILPDATVGDPHYTLTVAPSGAVTDVQVRTATVFPLGIWLSVAPGDPSAWIGPNSGAAMGGPPGTYTYRTTFDLSGFDPTTAVITGRWATDNTGSGIFLNGTRVGTYTASGFGSWSAFTINSGFSGGLNTLEFNVVNGPDPQDGSVNPTGLRVEFTSTDVTPSPEPGSLLLMGAGLVAFGAYRRRRA